MEIGVRPPIFLKEIILAKSPMKIGFRPIFPSENPRGADNQQERLIDRDQNPQRLHARHLHSVNEDIVPSAWRHAGVAVIDAIRLTMDGELR